MEEIAQNLGNDLAQAINSGNADRAIDIIQQLTDLDAQVQLVVQSKNDPIIQPPNFPIFQPPVVQQIQPPVKNYQQLQEQALRPQIQEVYQQLLDMGISPEQAREAIQRNSSLQGALNYIYGNQ